MLAPQVLDRVPPSDPEGERALLAASIWEPTNLDRVAEIVGPTDFFDADWGKFFDALQTMHDAGLPINDGNLLVSELKRFSWFEKVGGTAFLYGLLADGSVHAAHAMFYARNVRRAAVLRRQLLLGSELTRRAYDPDADPERIAEWLDAEVCAGYQNKANGSKSIGEIAASVLQEIREPASRVGNVLTGLKEFDYKSGGWCPGELIILAARPKIGKTALATQIGMHNAMQGRPVLFVSLEMKDKELITRAMCSAADVNTRRVRTKRLDEQDIARLAEVVDCWKGLPLEIDSPSSATVKAIHANAKRQKAIRGLDLVIVDYLSLIRPSDPRRPRHEQVAECSAGIKTLARELGVVVLCLAQLNRDAEGNTPELNHLRDSGAIEQDADMVLFIQRAREGDTSTTKLITAANRNGEEGQCTLRWIPERTRFECVETF
jgi:replicative DNA helicase